MILPTGSSEHHFFILNYGKFDFVAQSVLSMKRQSKGENIDEQRKSGFFFLPQFYHFYVPICTILQRET